MFFLSVVLVVTLQEATTIVDGVPHSIASYSTKNSVYSNDWAVEVYGGQEVADKVASEYNFINMGKVYLARYYCTQSWQTVQGIANLVYISSIRPLQTRA